MKGELKLNEFQLVGLLSNKLRSIDYDVYTEVPCLGKSLDVLCVGDKFSIFIEVKLRNWRQALLQCVSHELIADFICIAISTKTISFEFRKLARDRGYGIIQINEETGALNLILKPRYNTKKFEAEREVFEHKFQLIKTRHEALDDIQHFC